MRVGVQLKQLDLLIFNYSYLACLGIKDFASCGFLFEFRFKFYSFFFIKLVLRAFISPNNNNNNNNKKFKLEKIIL